MEVLERIAHTTQGLSYAEIQTATQIPTASLTRILGVLVNRAYLAKANDGKYKLGVQLFALGAIAGQQMDLLATVVPILNKLRDAAQETVEFAVLQGGELTILAKAESERSIRLFSQTGYRFKRLHVSGLGKVALAYMDPPEIEAYLAQADWTATTPKSITDPGVLRRELDQIRKRGYAFDDCEVREDIRRFAAPVFDAAGKFAGVIGIAAPAFRAPLKDSPRLGAAAKAAAEEISAALGYRART
jgi:IclR family transcriptional regulator, KDG regulon repressor